MSTLIIENLVEQRKYLRRSRNGSISVSSQGIRIIDILRRILRLLLYNLNRIN